MSKLGRSIRAGRGIAAVEDAGQDVVPMARGIHSSEAADKGLGVLGDGRDAGRSPEACGAEPDA